MNINLQVSGLSDVVRRMINMPGQYLAARKDALCYAGGALLKEMKKAIREGSINWTGTSKNANPKRIMPFSRWITNTPPFMRLKNPQPTRARAKAWASLINTFAFNVTAHTSEASSMDVGVIGGFRKSAKSGRVSAGAEAKANMITRGFTRQVTPAMRRYLAAIGVPLQAETTELTVPARPVVEPVWTRFKNQFVQMFQRKFIEKVMKGFTVSQPASNGGANGLAA